MHWSPFCQLIYQFIQITNLLHEWIWYLFDTITADDTGDLGDIWIHRRCLRKKCPEIYACIEYCLQPLRVISCQPIDDLIDLLFGTSFFLCLCDITGIDTRKCRCKYFGILHRIASGIKIMLGVSSSYPSRTFPRYDHRGLQNRDRT